jgi:hypothetical protein
MAKRINKTRRNVAQKEDHSRRNILIGAAIVLVLGALSFLLYLSLQEPELISGLERFVGLERAHDEQVDYSGQELPPVGGIHSGIWQNCGIYEEPVDAKNAVHSMEHGAVWVTYRPELEAGDIEELQDTVRGENYVLLSPYPELKSPVVLTAWGIQLEVDSADDSRIPEFVNRYQQGPQTPEFGASCSGGTGEPIN